ncbi:MAG: radical SAM protein [Planctomycetes bacterium]|nr:radical SAM protein [Planctomycetota bacterium]
MTFRKLKITFVDPPVGPGRRTPERVFGCTFGLYPMPNIFLLYAAAVAQRAGCQTRYINCPLEKWDRSKWENFVRADDSDIYAIYSVNLARQIDLESAGRIFSIRPAARDLFFGPAPTYDPAGYLIDSRCVVVRGEPETAFGRLGELFENPSTVAGASFIANCAAVHNPPAGLVEDLDSLPLPARGLLKRELYFNPKFGRTGAFTAMLTSRGCPHRCVFCVPNSLSFARELEHKAAAGGRKPPYRARGPQSVIDEFRALKAEGYTHVSIIDDEFAVQPRRAIEICEGIAGLGVRWGCLARADSLDGPLVAEMARAGCKYVDLGVESLDQAILDDIGKNLDVAAVARAVGLLKRSGIAAKLNILIGASPKETPQTVSRTVRAAIALKPDSIMFSICNPFPGTEYYEQARKAGLFVRGDYYPVDVQKESTISLPHLSKRQLEKAVRRANLRFFLSPRVLAGNLWRLAWPSQAVKAIVALWRKLA